MPDAKVNISKSVPYQIFSSDRFNARHGLLLSKTDLPGKDSAVSVYESGIVVIQAHGKTLYFDLDTGKISYS
jgi:hypothetical protein